MDNIYDVFVSYAREDAPYVRELVRALKSKGVRVWFDNEALRLGSSFSSSIEEALDRSRFLLAVLSPAYLESQWGNFELGVALSRYVPLNRLIPVYVRDVDPRRLPATVRNTASLHAKDLPIQDLANGVAEIVEKDKQTA